MSENRSLGRTIAALSRPVVGSMALAGAISHVLYVIEDLDSCFDGHWQVPRTPFERVSRQMAAAAPVQPVAVAPSGQVAGGA